MGFLTYPKCGACDTGLTAIIDITYVIYWDLISYRR